MKAYICTKYGPPEVLKLQEVKKPVPKDDEILIKIKATTVNAADARIRGAVFPSIFNIPVRLALGIKGPRNKILGLEIAGVVEAIGEKASRFKPGDEVFGSTGTKMGGYAEYICLSEKKELTQKPANMAFEEATAVPHCALTALHFLRKGNVGPGKKVLIYGASGGIGTFAVQLAKEMGAEVTGVCSTSNIDLVKSLGAKNVIDYTKEDFSQINIKYDVIFDTIGKSPISACAALTKEGGIYMLAVHLEIRRIKEGRKAAKRNKICVSNGSAPFKTENLNFLKNLIETEKLKTVIDKQYSFDQMIEAHSYVDKGHKKGHVTISITQ
ncbi:MAG: NAD(P)-dependent alcohol dehydrogenase [Prolixibacteraceae bacterium]|nr:NAD(P)-dependent alcohol dehydrogenase [Prolixibacteraceae bacterium]MBN2773983.1 NAD(P)-dependent alcohol dehydrogenase [Prolixibacteraceae bacterium]